MVHPKEFALTKMFLQSEKVIRFDEESARNEVATIEIYGYPPLYHNTLNNFFLSMVSRGVYNAFNLSLLLGTFVEMVIQDMELTQIWYLLLDWAHNAFSIQ